MRCVTIGVPELGAIPDDSVLREIESFDRAKSQVLGVEGRLTGKIARLDKKEGVERKCGFWRK